MNGWKYNRRMPYDETMAERIRLALTSFPLRPGEEVGEIKMFGGLCFTLGRKMFVGVTGDKAMIRLADDEMAAALDARKVTPMDFTGKPMRNFAYLTQAESASPHRLLPWIERSAEYVRVAMSAKRR